MARYVCIPAPIDLVDLLTGQKVEEPLTFPRVATIVCSMLARKATMDALSLIDLRTKLVQPQGTWIELTEDEWTAISSEFRRPSSEGFAPQAILQLGPHIRAILDATRDRPAALATNGVSATA